MTRSRGTRDSAVMMSSTTPSAKYSWLASAPMFVNGSTAIEGRSDALAGSVALSVAAALSSIARNESPVWPSMIASVRSENIPISSLSTVDLPSLVRKANCSREIRSRAM